MTLKEMLHDMATKTSFEDAEVDALDHAFATATGEEVSDAVMTLGPVLAAMDKDRKDNFHKLNQRLAVMPGFQEAIPRMHEVRMTRALADMNGSELARAMHSREDGGWDAGAAIGILASFHAKGVEWFLQGLRDHARRSDGQKARVTRRIQELTRHASWAAAVAKHPRLVEVMTVGLEDAP